MDGSSSFAHYHSYATRKAKSLEKSRPASWGNDGRKESRENNARLPAARLLLTYELEPDPGAPISWSQELGLNSKIHTRLWASKGQLRLECSERLFLLGTEILLEDVWATEKQNLSLRDVCSSQTLCFRDSSLSCFAKEKQQQLHDCSCSEGSTS